MPLGYPLPDPLDNGATICVRVDVPNVPEHRRAFISAVKSLTEWFAWARDDQKRGKDAATVWRPVLESVISQLSGNSDCTDCGEPCKDYAPDAPLIEYWPNDPFRTPEYLPPNYTLPPFYHNATISIPGVLPTDAMVNGAALGYDPLQSFQIFLNFLQILTGNPGFPNVEINCYGQGQVEVEFVKIIQGGLAFVLQDDDVDTLRIISLNAQNLQDLDLELLLELISGGDTGETVNTEIVEFNFTTTGPHTVKIIFMPNIGTDIVYGFGGGIRRVSLCGLSVLGSPDMFKLRQNEADNCLLEQSLDGGLTWLTAFDYGLCKPEPTKNRYIEQNGALVYQKSTDGGATWQDAAPETDPRHNAGTLSPLAGDARCDAACSAVAVIQNEVNGTIEYLNSSALASSIGAGIIAFLAIVGIATGGILTAIAAALATTLVNTGAAAFAAAFDSTVWDNLRCHLLHHVANDGGFDVTAWNAVKDDLSTDITGIARDHLWRMIDLMGSSGLTNAARLGAGTGCDCSGCETCTTYQVTAEDTLVPSVLGVTYRFAFSGTMQITSGAPNWGDAWGFYVATYAPTPRRQNDDGGYICIVVDGQPLDLTYSEDHNYFATIQGTGNNFVVKMNDTYPSDNSGYITMTVCHDT